MTIYKQKSHNRALSKLYIGVCLLEFLGFLLFNFLLLKDFTAPNCELVNEFSDISKRKKMQIKDFFTFQHDKESMHNYKI